jgi:hypothetical protein
MNVTNSQPCLYRYTAKLYTTGSQDKVPVAADHNQKGASIPFKPGAVGSLNEETARALIIIIIIITACPPMVSVPP